MSNKLFKLADVYNEEKIKILSEDNIELIVGEVILNRIVGIAYDNLDLSYVPKEIEKNLKILNKYSVESSERFIDNVHYISDILKNVDFQYALLKGSFLTTMLYKKGYRTSNDIDILINSNNISDLQSLLINNGFVQGHVDEAQNIIPATRHEVIQARLNYGETIPFYKSIKGNILEIDINFSLDYKPEKDKEIVSDLLENVMTINHEGYTFKTLGTVDFLIHLCCHLYKEATTYDWLQYRRDLMLYKFSDINVFIHEYNSKEFIDELRNRIVRFGLEKECYYTFKNSCEIFPHLTKYHDFVNLLESIEPVELSFMNEIIWPAKHKKFRHELSFTEWFNCKDRISMLSETVL